MIRFGIKEGGVKETRIRGKRRGNRWVERERR